MIINFPEEAEATFKRLLELHPGKTADIVLARAMCFYHACYELHLEGRTGEDIDILMNHLDEQDDKLNKEAE